MVIPSASARWASRVPRQSSKITRGPTYRRSWQTAQRRSYASAGGEGGHSTHKSSSDLPWAIASIAVTVPSIWYLIQPQLHPKKSHGHGHGNEGHGEEHGDDGDHEEKVEGGEDGESPEGEENKAGDQGGDEEKADENNSSKDANDEQEEESADGEGNGKAAPATPDDKGSDTKGHEREGGGNVEGVQFKGATSKVKKDGEQGDTRKHVPDAKGGSKLRIESDYGNKQGEANKPEQDPGNEDMAAASKATGKAGSNAAIQSSKQEGLSNTDTKHSTDIQNSPEKSKKAEGMPETAKSKGTVDPFRKQPETEQN